MVYYQRFTRSDPGSTTSKKQKSVKKQKNITTPTFDWQRITKDVFADRHTSAQAERLKEIQKAIGSVDELVFVSARKVTGDFHVPMGQLSFSALVSPALKISDKWQDLHTITDRNTQRVRHIVRRWMGWCTLAYKSFKRPSWAEGVLVQIAPEREEERSAFAFCVDGDNQEAIVLGWLPAQDNEPFLLHPPPEGSGVE